MSGSGLSISGLGLSVSGSGLSVSGSVLSVSGSGLSVSASGLCISGSGLSVSGSRQDVVTSAEGDLLHFKLCGVRSASTGTAVHVAIRPDPLVGDCHTKKTRHSGDVSLLRTLLRYV